MRVNGILICDNNCNNPATKRHRAGNFYYCDQCVWELGLRDVVAIGENAK